MASKLEARGLRYSRYVDDVTVSSIETMSDDDKTWAIGQLVAMMGSRGFRAKRDKHEIQSGNARISVMKLNVNREIGLSARERAQIRAAVHQLEQFFDRGNSGPEFRQEMDRVVERIGRLGRFHEAEAARLQGRVQAMRNAANFEASRSCLRFAADHSPRQCKMNRLFRFVILAIRTEDRQQ